jgi:hypothetical protein
MPRVILHHSVILRFPSSEVDTEWICLNEHELTTCVRIDYLISVLGVDPQEAMKLVDL